MGRTLDRLGMTLSASQQRGSHKDRLEEYPLVVQPPQLPTIFQCLSELTV